MTKQEFIKKWSGTRSNDIKIEKDLNRLLKENTIAFSEWEFTYGGNVISLSKQYDLFIKQQKK